MSDLAGPHPSRATDRKLAAGILFAVFLTTAAVYWPGLPGGYIFDDYSSIVDNVAVHVTSLNLGEWVRAALSFPAGHQGRWLTMLSFAANYYFAGLDPFWMKVTNLFIHLFNGGLLYLVFRALLDLWQERQARWVLSAQYRRWACAALAGAWLLLPINLAAVLYAAQRHESLCNIFIFLGMWLYLRARLRLARDGVGYGAMIASLILGTGIGCLAKESAVLLPLYTLCVEFAIGSFRDRQIKSRLFGLYGLLLIVPLLIGLVWLASWFGTATAPARPFNTIERLLTESRIVLDYIGWTILPTRNALGMYHDDIAISHGLLDPPSTLAAILALGALLGVAFWQRARRPMFSLGIFWFFAGHMLTATIIPLELVFEHRNYFPSCGLLLAVAAIGFLEPIASMRPRIVGVLATVVIAFYGSITSLRAHEWSNPVSFALAEAAKHPRSLNAQYEVGRSLIIASGKQLDSPLIPLARSALESGMALPGTSILCEQALIVLAARRHEPIEPVWWQSINDKLQSGASSEGNISALTSLLDCQIRTECPAQASKLGVAFLAAINHPNPNARLISTYGKFAAEILHDNVLAERMMRQAVEQKPNVPTYRTDLIQFLQASGQRESALVELKALEQLNHFGSLDPIVDKLHDLLGGAAQDPANLPPPGNAVEPKVKGDD